MTRFKVKAGDFVSVTWEDAVSWGRIEAAPGDLPLPVFKTFGKVGYVDSKKIVILHEEEMPRSEMPEGISKRACIEPTGLPMGIVTDITVHGRRR